MKRYFLFSVTAALMLIWLAATWSVSLAAVSGGVVGNGTPGSCSEAAFNAALSGGGSLTFNCGAAPHTITITTRKTITADTLIDGGNLITLSGSSGVFLAPTGKSLTLQNLTLSGAASSTGSLENRGRLTLRNVVVRDNARGLNNLSGGAAIILGSLFQNNRPSGAIFNQSGALTVTNTSFVANKAYNGGAIDNENGGQLHVTDSTFDSNSSGNSGGAIYSGDSTTTRIAASWFISNGLGLHGGAIYNLGNMTVTRGEFQRNRSVNSGGGITNWGTLTVQESSFVSNTATSKSGGGIAHFNLTTDPKGLSVSSSVFYSNTSGQDGGGISFQGGDNNWFNLTNTTLSQNRALSAPGGGGVHVSGGSAALKQVTFFGNTSVATPGGNLQNSTVVTHSVVTLQNTLFVSGGCAGPLADGGGNLQDATSIGCGASLTADPQLGPLQDNGGWTLTHALPANSPARDAGSNANCAAFDQRGVTRPQNGACDSGAFEYGAQPGITSIGPDFVGHGGPAFTLTVNGADFIPGPMGSRVLWAGSPMATTFVSSTQLTANVPANLITLPGQVTITAETASADGGVSAGARRLVIGYWLYLPLVIR